MTLYVHGLGHFHPENEITNKFLESLDIGTSDDWIMERVGIRARRTVLPLDYIKETKNLDPREGARVNVYDNGQLGARAAQLAVERAGISMSDIGMVIGGGSVPYTLSPVDAANIAVELGLEVPVIDINSACTSFFAGMRMLSMMREDALPEYVLLVATDAMTRSIDYSDRASAVLWGDAAAAAVVSTKLPSPVEVVSTSLTSSPAGRDKVFVPRFGHFDQEGRTVQMFAIRKTSALLGQLIAEHSEDGGGIHFVGHQANLRMLESVCARCDIPPERHHSNAEFYGNTGAASATSVISMRWEKWQPGDQIAVVGVGAGLTWASFLLRFTGPPGEISQ
jgi:3-oxoacyl-[acyl-carrier-protein] synthase-3